MARKSRPRAIPPTGRVLAVLDAVARLRNPSVSALADALRLPVATAHRICAQLERLGHLQRVPGTRLWSVAPAAVALAARVLDAAAQGVAVSAILKGLTARLGEMSSFAVAMGDEVVYVASVEPPHELTVSFRAGRKAPLFCTSSGRLFLARLDDRSVRRYLEAVPRPAFTKFTVTDPEKLLAIIRRIRVQGYAITRKEYVQHVVGAAVPVERADGTFYGALSIAAPDVRMPLARLRSAVPALKAAAGGLAVALGGEAGRAQPPQIVAAGPARPVGIKIAARTARASARR